VDLTVHDDPSATPAIRTRLRLPTTRPRFALHGAQRWISVQEPDFDGMELYDPQGRRLYLTAEERAAFLTAAKAAPREVRTFCLVL